MPTPVTYDPFAGGTPVTGNPFAAPLPKNAYRLPSGEITYKGLGDPLTGLIDDYAHRQSQYGREGAQEAARGVKNLSAIPDYAKTHNPLMTAHRAAEDVTQTALGAVNYLAAPLTAIPDSTVGRAADVLTGGAVPTRTAGMVASLLTPLGEERALAGAGSAAKALKSGELNPMSLLKRFNAGAQEVDKTLANMAAADRVKRAQNVAKAKPTSLRDPASRAAARLANTFKRSDVNDTAEAQRAAGIKPTMIGATGPETHRAGRAAAVVSPAAEAAALNERTRARIEAPNTAVSRIRREAPHGDVAPDQLIEQRRAQQREQANADYAEVPDLQIEVPDKVLELARSSGETRSALSDLISNEREYVLQPDKFPNAEQHLAELRKIASYDKEMDEWQAAKAKYDKDKAAYDKEVGAITKNANKDAAAHEKAVADAQAAHEKALAGYEARKAAHDKRSFNADDFTGKIKTNDLVFLNKADVLNAKPGSPTAQVRDAMFETYGYKPRGKFAEQPPTLELPDPPRTVEGLKAPESPGPKPARPTASPGALDFLKQRLVARARDQFTKDKALGGAISGHANDIEDALDGVEELAPARANFKAFEIRKNLLEMNPDIIWSDPAEFAFQVKRALKGEEMTPEMKADLTHNILWRLTDKASKDPASMMRLTDSFTVGGYFPKNLVTILGKENADKLTTAMKGLTEELRGLNTMTSGSKTAHNVTDTLGHMQDATHVASSLLNANPVHAGFSAARMFMRFKERMTPAEGEEVMKFLTSYKTPEDAMSAIEALVKRNAIPPEAPPNIRKILNKAIAGQAVSRVVPQPQFDNPAEK